MDFGNLLHAAKRNSDKKSDVKYYSTKFEPPKKENKEKKLSANIQKFLAKKDAEEKQQNEFKRLQREQLIANRTPKAQKKIEKMLKVIKSANKSVLADAVDHDNTAVTLQGPAQPDEDDYGYVSQEASLYYNKIMEKYQNLPEEKKFSSSGHKQLLNKDQLMSTKNRVREAINRQHEEESLPHRRQRQAKSNGDAYNAEVEREYEEKQLNEKKVKKPNRPAPPPLDFNQLLKLAEQRQFEPVQVEMPISTTKDPERLMSKKEKRDFEERQAFMEAREIRLKNRDNPQTTKTSTSGASSGPTKSAISNGRIPKINGAHKIDKPGPAPLNNGRIPKLGQVSKPSVGSSSGNNEARKPSIPSSSHSSTSSSSFKIPNSSNKVPQSSSSKTMSATSKSHPNYQSLQKHTTNSNTTKPISNSQPTPGKSKENISKVSYSRNSVGPPPAANPKTTSSTQNGRPQGMTNGKNPSLIRKQPPTESNSRPISTPNGKLKPKSDVRPRQLQTPDGKPRQFPPADVKSRSFPTADVKTRPFPPADVKTRQFPPADMKTRQFPPADMKTRQFPPADVKTRQFPPADVRRKPQQPPMKKRRILDEDDSEYDSEMDDFIDDGDAEEDYSKYIKEIFGYDKSKFRNEDYDDRSMESSFAQVMREEYVSKKIGIMEDLEDMRQEALEKKMKAQKKKRKVKD